MIDASRHCTKSKATLRLRKENWLIFRLLAALAFSLSTNSALAEELLDGQSSCFWVEPMTKERPIFLDVRDIEPMGNNLFLITSDAPRFAAIMQFLTLADCRSRKQYTLKLGFWDGNTPNANVDAFRDAAVTAADDIVEDLARRFYGGFSTPLWTETCTCLGEHVPR